MTQFAHIVPTAYLDDFAKGRPFHLTLAHLIEQDPTYTNWYANRDDVQTNIMDNSAFEMYKQNRPMYPSDKLIEMGHKVKADYIVMSDYPNQHPEVTIASAEQSSETLRSAGFGTFFVPQSKIGDQQGLLSCFDWAAESSHVDYIGISILGVPNAYGVENNNKLQRFLSRWHFLLALQARGILQKAKSNGKKFHMLGMVDGPNEIALVKEFLPYIDSWDSSAAVWAGFNDIRFDGSPTGLLNGKFEEEVDFNFNQASYMQKVNATLNTTYIDSLLEIVNE